MIISCQYNIGYILTIKEIRFTNNDKCSCLYGSYNNIKTIFSYVVSYIKNQWWKK